jgi:uncharacterized protein YjcR
MEQKALLAQSYKGWALAALANELEITPNTVEKWKAGDRNPRKRKQFFFC